jgi:Uma2 family endonuclease
MTFTAAMIADVLTGDTDPGAFNPPLPERFEVVDGRVVGTPEMSAYSNKVAKRLDRAVELHLGQNDVGETDIEALFHIPQPEDKGRNRRPDWAFTSYDRWPKDKPWSFRGNARDVVPDIAAEIVSPTDPADDLIAKVREYLRGGVRLVWVVYPLAREVHAYRPGSATVQVHVADADLDAPDVLPGFRTPVGPLFPPTA